MKRAHKLQLALCLPFLFVAVNALPAFQPYAAPDALRRDVNRARERVYPALVNITAVMRFHSEGRTQRRPAGGSGVIVSPQGHVLTNYHVAGNTTRIICTLTDGESIEASVVAHDPPTDLSVLKLRTERRAKGARSLPYAVLGNSDAVKIGDHVLALGNPMMLSSSLTLGVVSNPRRVFTDFTGSGLEEVQLDDDEPTGMFTRWIQHDALILPGNSGGPLVNLRGEVVGINELGGSGMGFAIPSNTAARVLRQAQRYGEVRRGWLGVSMLPVGKLGRSTGGLVASIWPRSPAEKAGLRPGDVLLSLGGAPVRIRFAEEIPPFYQQVADHAPGTSVRLRYLRNGARRSTTVRLTRMKPYATEEEELRKLGVTVRELTEAMALARRLPVVSGVLVTGVRPGYPLETARPQIRAGDVITHVGGKPVRGLSDFVRAAAALKPGEVSIGFRREHENLVTVAVIESRLPENENAELPKAWIGIKTQVVTPQIAAALRMSGAKGFRVTEVLPETEAAKAGLMPGDVITALNEEELEASRPQDEEDLRRLVEELDVGGIAALSIVRGGARKSIRVKLQPTPASAPQARIARQEELEFTVRDITPLDRMENHWKPDQRGVLVVEATSGGWAHMSGLRLDDLLLSINDRPTPGVIAFEAALRDVLRKRPRVIRLFVRRGIRTDFVFIEPDWTRLAAGH